MSEKRIKACNEEIAEVLKRHNCAIVGMPTFTQEGRVVAVVRIVARPQEETNDTGS